MPSKETSDRKVLAEVLSGSARVFGTWVLVTISNWDPRKTAHPARRVGLPILDVLSHYFARSGW